MSNEKVLVEIVGKVKHVWSDEEETERKKGIRIHTIIQERVVVALEGTDTVTFIIRGDDIDTINVGDPVTVTARIGGPLSTKGAK